MTRSVNPATRYHDNNGNLLLGGRMFFYKCGTREPIEIFSDVDKRFPSRNPVILDGAGTMPDVFFDGQARQVLEDSSGLMLWERDPVTNTPTGGNFSDYDANATYSKNEVVLYEDAYYRSLQPANIDNTPDSSPEFWVEVEFLEDWNESITYPQSDTVRTIEGIWSSTEADNLNNIPSTTGFWKALGADAFAYVDNYVVQNGFGVETVQDVSGITANVIFNKDLALASRQTVFAKELINNRVYYVDPATIDVDRAGVKANTYNQVVVAPDGPFIIVRFVT